MIIIGCDLHTRRQQIAMLDRETGEVVERCLEHENGEAKRFYEGLKAAALVGIESTGFALWFQAMLSELGHELVVGDAAKIRACGASIVAWRFAKAPPWPKLRWRASWPSAFTSCCGTRSSTRSFVGAVRTPGGSGM